MFRNVFFQIRQYCDSEILFFNFVKCKLKWKLNQKFSKKKSGHRSSIDLKNVHNMPPSLNLPQASLQVFLLLLQRKLILKILFRKQFVFFFRMHNVRDIFALVAILNRGLTLVQVLKVQSFRCKIFFLNVTKLLYNNIVLHESVNYS